MLRTRPGSGVNFALFSENATGVDLCLFDEEMRNFVATLLLSQGVPMLSGGDEIARTQAGNNNAYCQDNELSWFRPAGGEMADEDWSNAFTRCFGLRLAGDAISEVDAQGAPIVDDTLMILVNAWHEPIDFVGGRAGHAGASATTWARARWRCFGWRTDI